MSREEADILRDEQIETVLSEIGDRVRSMGPEEVALRAGISYQGDAEKGLFLVPLFGQTYRVTYPELEVEGPPGEAVERFHRGIILYYLRGQDHGPGRGEGWTSFRDLPGGRFYSGAFQGYSGDVLSRELGQDPHLVERACLSLGGTRQDMGDVAFSFSALPRVTVAVVLWEGDSEFPPRATILFNSGCTRHLPTDAMAGLGSHVVRAILQASGRDLSDL